MNHSEMDRVEVVRSEMDRVKAERGEIERFEMDGRGSEVSMKPEVNMSEMDIQPFLRMRNQFVCAACGIRFKSLDNLQAHQTYYCTKRAGGPAIMPPITGTSSNNSTSSDPALKMSHEDNGEVYSRKRANGSCSNPGEKMNHSVTNGNPKTRSSTTSQQVQSFQCTVCGYKGHTLRGMRTHVRMHTEELQGASEEDFIDHLDRSAMVLLSNGTGSKKRTSGGAKRRKSVDHSHHDEQQQVTTTNNHLHSNHDHDQLISTPATTASSTSPSSCPSSSCPSSSCPSSSCPLLGGQPNFSSSKLSPMEVERTLSESEESVTHESSIPHSQPHFNCFHCSYKSNYYGDIVRHMKLVHKDSPFNPILSVDLHPETSDHSGDDNAILGIKHEPSNAIISKPSDHEMVKRRRRERNVPSRPSSNHSNNSLPLPLMKRSPEPNAELLRPGTKLSNGSSKDSGSKDSGSSESSSLKNSLKYCEECDISFNFVNSYLAHKQFYCSANKS